MAAPRPSPVYLLVGLASWPVIRFLFRLRWRGLEHVPREGGAVLAANHNSNLDPWPLGLPLFPRRFLRFMGKSELFWFPLGAFISAGGAFKVRRGEADPEAIETAVALVRDGPPRGHVPGGDAAREGAAEEARGALAHGRGADRARGRRAARARRDRGHRPHRRLAPLRVVYGEPIPLDDLRDRDAKDAAAEATERLRAEIERLEATL